MLRPGAERVAALGGLHKFMNWPHPILTDSGGFQVMSLSGLRKLDEKGVTFRSHLNGDMFELTPERAIEIQNLLGADIVMQLDECLKLPASPQEIKRARGLGAVRHRPGRRQPGPAAGECAGAGRHRLSRLCHRRARRGRTAGGDAGHGRGDGAGTAGGPPALFDGRRHARGYL
jgi:queuine tRNA-ribosyltransferase